MKKVLRYIYLNIYGICLIMIAGALVFLLSSFNQNHVFVKIGICCFSIFIGYKGCWILFQWKEKKRWYAKLMSINKNAIKDESFRSFIGTPCGNLLTKSVLRDLGKYREYKRIKAKYCIGIKEWILNIKNPPPSEVKITKYGKQLLKDLSK